jgi:hypothetical protein
MLALAIPLMLLIVEYNAKPAVVKASEVIGEPLMSIGGDESAPLSVSQAKALWADIDSRVKKLERSERKRDFVDRILDTPAKAQTIMGCALAAWLLQVLSFGWEERQKKRKTA